MLQPPMIIIQSPEARKIVEFVAARPDWFRPATATATTPSPKAIRTNVPKYSERNSPQTVVRQAAPAPMRVCHTPAIPLGSIADSDTSTSLSRNADTGRSARDAGGVRLPQRGAAPALQRHGAARCVNAPD